MQAFAETQTEPSGQRDCKWVEADPFWHDMKQSGKVTGGQSNHRRRVNPCSLHAIGEQSTDCLRCQYPLETALCKCRPFGEDVAGLVGSLESTVSETKSSCGSRVAWV